MSRRGRGGRDSVLTVVLVCAAPLLMASSDDEPAPDDWPEVSQPNVDASVHSIPLDETVYGITLEDFIEPLQAEEVDGDTTTVTIASDVLFEFDEADLTGRAESTIAAIASDLEGAAGTVTVVGHTDGVGEADYNQQLSEDRAQSVADALEGELGSGIEIEASGRGMDEPVADENTDDPTELSNARAENRRVEISYGGS